MNLFCVFLDLGIDIEGSSFFPGKFLKQSWDGLLSDESKWLAAEVKEIGISDKSVPDYLVKMLATFSLETSGFKYLALALFTSSLGHPNDNPYCMHVNYVFFSVSGLCLGPVSETKWTNRVSYKICLERDKAKTRCGKPWIIRESNSQSQI